MRAKIWREQVPALWSPTWHVRLTTGEIGSTIVVGSKAGFVSWELALSNACAALKVASTYWPIGHPEDAHMLQA